MARRRRVRGRGKRTPVFWDDLKVSLASLPSGSIAAAATRDGAFSSITRYGTSTSKVGGDLLIRRTIVQFVSQGIMDMATTANDDLVIELCVGLSIFDSMGDTDGVAANTTIVAGTGPTSDADNSRWYVRCCIQIPFGTLRGFGAVTAYPMVIPYESAREYAKGHLLIGEDAAEVMSWAWFCEVDSKSMRKMEGIQTENVQVAMEVTANQAIATGNSFTWSMDQLSGRHLLSKRS